MADQRATTAFARQSDPPSSPPSGHDAYDRAMRSDRLTSFAGLPGAELVSEGIEDLLAERQTALAALVSMAAPRLRQAGLDVPAAGDDGPPSYRLYELLARADPATAHRRYNALVGRIVSFARAAERASQR